MQNRSQNQFPQEYPEMTVHLPIIQGGQALTTSDGKYCNMRLGRKNCIIKAFPYDSKRMAIALEKTHHGMFLNRINTLSKSHLEQDKMTGIMKWKLRAGSTPQHFGLLKESTWTDHLLCHLTLYELKTFRQLSHQAGGESNWCVERGQWRWRRRHGEEEGGAANEWGHRERTD